MAVRVPAAASLLYGTRYDWTYRTVPQRHLRGRRVYWARGRALGGSSTINAQVYLRGHPADYDRWEALGNEGWAYEHVLPYFQRSEHDDTGRSALLGREGPLHLADLRDPSPFTRDFVAACVGAGLRLNEDLNRELDGVGYPVVTQRNGVRWSAADAYLRPAVGRPNLSVVTGARALRILFEGRRAVGVAYLKDGVTHVARAAAEVILSGGVVSSPQLLLLSGVGPAAHLRELGIPVVHDLPGVGRNLQDHVGVSVQVSVRNGSVPATARSIAGFARYVALRAGPLTSNASEALAFARSAPSLPAPDVEVVFSPPPLRPVFLTPGWLLRRTRDALQRMVSPSAPAAQPAVVTFVPVVLQPKSAGFIDLCTRDPLAAPRIDPAYLSDDEGHDMDVLVAGMKLVAGIATCPPLAPRLPAFESSWPGGREADGPELHELIRRRAVSLQHPVGTCKMGVDASAVVDATLRVHGVAGLRVVDASVIPTITRGHMNAAVIMIAEKASDLIRERTSPTAARLPEGVS